MRKALHSDEHVALRERLRAARLAADLTQQKVADALGVPQSYVAKYEGGERRIDVVEFVAIARAVGRDPLELLGDLVAVQRPSKPRRRARRTK